MLQVLTKKKETSRQPRKLFSKEKVRLESEVQHNSSRKIV